MSLNFTVSPGDVLEATLSYVALDQLIQYKFDIKVDGTGTTDSNNTMATLTQDWTSIAALLGTSTKHVQTRLQQITDCVLGTTGKPKRVRGLLAKKPADNTLDGGSAAPFCPLNNTVSVQLITSGNPKKFWGKKGFGQLPLTVLGSDGEKLATLARAAWDTQTGSYFTTPHVIGGGTLSFVTGILPTTYVANLPGPHGAMSGYIYQIVAVEVGYYLGTQKTRDIEPQATLGH